MPQYVNLCAKTHDLELFFFYIRWLMGVSTIGMKELEMDASNGCSSRSVCSLLTRGTIFSSIFNLLTTIIGAGTLALPYAFREGGLIFSSVLFFAVLLIATLVGLFLYDSQKISKDLFPSVEIKGYADLAELTIGKVGRVRPYSSYNYNYHHSTQFPKCGTFASLNRACRSFIVSVIFRLIKVVGQNYYYFNDRTSHWLLSVKSLYSVIENSCYNSLYHVHSFISLLQIVVMVVLLVLLYLTLVAYMIYTRDQVSYMRYYYYSHKYTATVSLCSLSTLFFDCKLNRFWSFTNEIITR